MPKEFAKWPGVKFERVYIGIAWPAEKPGFIVVIGEEATSIEAYGREYRHYVLEEVEEENLHQLLRRCSELIGTYNAERVIGRYDEHVYPQIPRCNNEARKLGLPEIRLDTAPYSKDKLISTHINLLQDKLSSAKQSLYLGEGSILSGRIESEVLMDAIYKATDEQYPATAALGYVISVMVSWPPNRSDEDDSEDGDYEYRKRTACRSTGY